MTNEDFASNVALEVNSRLAKILPCLNGHLADEDNSLNELQQIALGSLILEVFSGLTEAVEWMTDVFQTLRQFSDSPFLEPLTDEGLAAWLSEDDNGPLQ